MKFKEIYKRTYYYDKIKGFIDDYFNEQKKYL